MTEFVGIRQTLTLGLPRLTFLNKGRPFIAIRQDSNVWIETVRESLEKMFLHSMARHH